ncbi:hypothetical protein D7Z26_11090 [Cohnella endophytica]|uniref:Uncharacterized protein n=1 Tax=Cohnella endophytica TaxID=2419778 RepID=A0A494Y0Q8_9BACL|nr:hypothetical protein [Cohnella endophytica]RKP53932.1 hypothetical protein D7Z26_11090 [Cohnella endophytica]
MDNRNRLLVRLMKRKSLPSLVPDYIWHPGVDEEIAALSESEMANDRPDGWSSARAWKAALHLWNDSLAAAHRIVEPMNSPTSAALHGIVHRREGDFGNAKIWFRMAGDHPAFHGLQSRAASFLRQQRNPPGPLNKVFGQIVAQGSWNPYLFIEAIAIQTNHIGEEYTRNLLEWLQQLELEAFMRYLEGRIAFERPPVEFAE